MRRSSKCGFSLVEVVVALGLFSFCIVGILGLMSNGLGVMRGGVEDVTSAGIAKQLAAEYQQSAIDSILTTGATTCTFPDRSFNSEGQEVPSTDPYVIYTASVVATSDVPAPTNLVKITINVKRKAATSNNSITKFVTYVARN